MILRAKISRRVDNYHYTVRIPQWNKMREAIGATPESELYTATISTSPGLAPALKTDDTVLVAFENGSESSPTIIGVLFNSAATKIQSDAAFTSLDVSVNAKFSEDVTIGNVTKENIKCLENLRDNLKIKLQKVDELIGENANQIVKVKDRTTKLESTVAVHTQSINTNATNIKENSDAISKHKDDDIRHITSEERSKWNGKAEAKHTHTRADISGLGTVILDKTSYGSSLPANGTQGQLFFKIT